MSQEDISTVIGKDVYVKGDLTVHSSIVIEGTLTGSLTSTGKVLITVDGEINGDVIVKEIVISGKINGNLTATGNAVIEPGATLNGDLYTAKVTLAEGSKFNGKCTMIKRKELVVEQNTKEVKLIELSPEEMLTQS